MARRFHPPKGDLYFWSVLWLAFGLFGTIYALVAGEPRMLFSTIPVGLLTLGIWMRIKVCGQILMALMVFGCFMAIALMIMRGEFSWHRLFRICLSVYFVYLLWGWTQSFEDDRPVAHEPDSDSIEPR